jgi:hypothetical protein
MYITIVSLSIVKVDLDVGWWSQEERASTGAIVATAGNLEAALHRRTHGVTYALLYAALEWVLVVLLLN